MKAMIAALSFIFEKSAKNHCSPEDVEKEMLQIGFSAGMIVSMFIEISRII